MNTTSEGWRPFSIRHRDLSPEVRAEAIRTLTISLKSFFANAAQAGLAARGHPYGSLGPGDQALADAVVITGRSEFHLARAGGGLFHLPPVLIFDLCEIIRNNKGGARVERVFNEAMTWQGEPWRMIDGEICKPEETFLDPVADDVLDATQAAGMTGARKCFSDALRELRQKEPDDAITDARQALESALKWFFDEENGRTLGDLLKALRRFINENPDVGRGYFQPLMDGFGKLINVVAAASGQDGAHAGAEPHDIPMPVAKLVVHLTGSLILYLAESKPGSAQSE